MIIAISGKKGSGKSEISLMLQYLISCDIANFYIEKNHINCYKHYPTYPMYLNYKEQVNIFKKLPNSLIRYVRQDQFAFPLKKMCAGLIGCNIEDFENRDFKNAYSNFKTNIASDPYYKDAIVNLTNREVLIYFGDIVRKNNPYYFVQSAINRHVNEITRRDISVTIISDLRLKDEIDILKKEENVVLIRLHRNINDEQIINHDTENDLDDYKDWNFEIYNENEGLEHLWEQMVVISKLLNIV